MSSFHRGTYVIGANVKTLLSSFCSIVPLFDLLLVHVPTDLKMPELPRVNELVKF